MIEGVESLSGNSFQLRIDLKIYSLTSVKKTVYKFTNRFGVFIKSNDENEVIVSFNPEDDSKLLKVENIYNEFCNELLDNDLREIIYSQTEGRRNLILAKAFTNTNLLEEN